MAKYTPSPVGNAYNSSAAGTVNTNWTDIAAALENTLSRDGTSPNQMAADIDLNENDLLNVNAIDVATLTVAGEAIDLAGIATDAGRAEDAAAAAEAAQAAAEAAAGSGNFSAINSRAEAITTNISAPVDYINTAGYYAAGDGGDGLYKRAVSEPSHGGKFQSADGAWWELVVDLATTVNSYGSLADNTTASDGTDNTAFIQAMIDHVGYYRLGMGRYKITDKLTIPSQTISLLSFGAKFTGVGKEKSTLIAYGMTGKAMFGPQEPTGLYRFHMADHSMYGDADSCVDFTLNVGDHRFFKSSFVNMGFTSVAGPSFYANLHFASRWEGCNFSSTSGHSIHLGGGNSTVLTNCYVHNMGSGKAGFRIEGHATLVECVGVDQATGACYWGHFGKDGTGIYHIEIVGGNAEDFGTAAILLEYSGHISIANLAMVARASGTFTSYIEMVLGNTHSVIIRGNTLPVSKGATRSGSSNIVGTGGNVYVEDNASTGVGAWPDLYNTTAALLYEIPTMAVRSDDFGRYSFAPNRINSERELGFVAATPTNITANAATYSMATLTNVLRTANTSSTLLTNITIPAAVTAAFNGPVEGQRLQLLINDNFTTIRHLIGGAGRFELIDSVDRVCVSGEVLEFAWIGSIWRQMNPRRTLRASATVNPASMAINTCTTPATITVTGAVLGDFARASFSLSLAGASLHAYVSAADTVTYYFRNDIGTDPLDLGSGTLRVEVSKA